MPSLRATRSNPGPPLHRLKNLSLNCFVANAPSSDVCISVLSPYLPATGEPMAEDDIPFDRNFDPNPDEVQQVSPLICRVLVPNTGLLAFIVTCTYIVGRGAVPVADP